MAKARPLEKPPKEGNYYTSRDIEHDLIKPKKINKPEVPKPKTLKIDKKPPPESQKPKESVVPRWRSYFDKWMSGDNPVNGNTNHKIKKQTKEELAKEAELKAAREKLALLPAIFRPFVSGSLQRAYGAGPAYVTGFETKEVNDKLGGHQKFYIILCLYQCLFGALGGIALGIDTGYFSAKRLAAPNVNFPVKFVERILHHSVQKSSIVYRVGKRTLVSGLVFDLVDRHLEEYRGKKDWRNMGMSGIITGGLFGLRGGLRGARNGAAVFGVFAAMAGIFFHYRGEDSNQD